MQETMKRHRWWRSLKRRPHLLEMRETVPVYLFVGVIAIAASLATSSIQLAVREAWNWGAVLERVAPVAAGTCVGVVALVAINWVIVVRSRRKAR